MCSENEGADQLCNYCTADLRLRFHICCWFSYAAAQLLNLVLECQIVCVAHFNVCSALNLFYMYW